MASILNTIITEVANIAVTIAIDQAELKAGGLVKVGEVGSVGGEPVFVYLSTNASAT